MRFFNVTLLLLWAAACGQAQTTGYWQRQLFNDKTDSYIRPYDKGTPYPDTYGGGEGDL